MRDPAARHAELGKRPGSGPPLPPATLTGFGVAFLAVGVIFLFTWQSLDNRNRASDLVSHTLEVQSTLEAVLSQLKDAETGQRGFLLTGDERYLAPFTKASADLSTALARLKVLLNDNPTQLDRLGKLDPLLTEKFDEMNQTVSLRREGKTDTAVTMVRTDRGQVVMEQLRSAVAQMQAEESALLTARQEEWRAASRLSTLVTAGGANVLALLIAIAALVSSRQFRSRETEAWLRLGVMGLSQRMQGEQRLEVLGANVLTYLAEFLDARVGAIHLAEGEHSLRRFASYGLPANTPVNPERTGLGEGLVGQAAKDLKLMHLKDLPVGYLPIGSSLGQGAPRELLIAPAVAEGTSHAVIELGLLRAVKDEDLELLRRASWTIAMAIASSRDRTQLEGLLEETQRQAEELQTQQEELRVSNEELEQQSRQLKESQARLEGQQAELEETNAQLEEQAQALENQKEELTISQQVLTDKAQELERANLYKSEFLANMSHELRTPLNSSLILAKLLADNKQGNLSEEQVRYAQTISSAGNDLLLLINDILDLAKIESGKVEVRPEPLDLARVLDPLKRTFQPAAQQKGLRFSATLAEGAPARIETDAQRLGQILKNLLSNALKFTEKGSVALEVSSLSGERVAFAVRDSGIGIPPHQQGVIFEAFRQADGSTQRRFGGTGLGLSISRDLARLLGGDIAVESAAGAGSTFTLTLPLRQAPRSAERPKPERHAAPPVPAAGQPLSAPVVDDDRERLGPGSRVILVVEDDVHFATILRDLGRELGFHTVLTHTVADGLAAVARYHPHAVLLDVNLPDHSGLGVLDQLKHDPQTRHIPVHVISVADHSKQALELGAVGYALKPVQREELIAAFRKLEARISQALRRVLVVEDDARQRESVRSLLESEEVEIVGVATAAEALAALGSSSFDCMVIDLNLPDLSGYELLEQMAQRENASSPPVIVYTGRTLSRLEEQNLQRFSRTIIIKGARSPERLLDEVTLFLHQVEAKLPVERQRMLREARSREAALEGKRILVVEDDVRSVFALSSVFEPRGARVQIARNGLEALDALATSEKAPVDLVLMDIMMPEMDGITAMREIRKRPEWQKLPIIALTAKAMKDDQERCLAAGANDYIAKPLDVEKLLSLVRVWMPR